MSIDDISSCKEYLLNLVFEDKKNLSQKSIETIPSIIQRLFEAEVGKGHSGLKVLKAKKDALLSSLYYSNIALNALNVDPLKRSEVFTKINEMITKYDGDFSEFERQYDELVPKYNKACLECLKEHKEMTELDRKHLKFCIILGDLLKISLNDNQRQGKEPLPTRIPMGEEAIAYNKAALKINRQIELKRIEEYKKMTNDLFLSSPELVKSSPEFSSVELGYETIMKKDYLARSNEDLEHLHLLAEHHARNLGLDIAKVSDNEELPLIGVDELNLPSMKWKEPDYELRYRFLIDVLKCDLLTCLKKTTINRDSKQSSDEISKLAKIGRRFELYFSKLKDMEDWENVLAAGLSINAHYKYLNLDHSQKIGEDPWIFDFNKQSTYPIYNNFLLEIKTDMDEIDRHLQLQTQLIKYKNDPKKIQNLKFQIENSNKSLRKKFQTVDTKELMNIKVKLSQQIQICHYILEGTDKYIKNFKFDEESGNAWAFVHRGENVQFD